MADFDPTRTRSEDPYRYLFRLVYCRAGLSRARRRSLSPHPQVSHDLYGRREDQRAKGRFRHRLHRPLDQHAMDHTPYDDDHREGHMSDAPRSQSQSPAECSQKRDGEDCPHGDHTEGGERRRRCEEKGVNHVRRAGDPKAPDVDHHHHDQRASDPVMCASSTISRQSRQVSGNQQRLNEHEPQCDNPCESGQYVDRTAPFKQRARRCSGDRHENGGCKERPRSGSPGPISFLSSQLGQTG